MSLSLCPLNTLRFAAPPVMASIFQSLLFVIARATQRELARQVRYLKVENEVLRAKLPERITVAPKERQRLLKFGAKPGKAIHQIVTIVTPGTFLRWIREENEPTEEKCRAHSEADDVRLNRSES